MKEAFQKLEELTSALEQKSKDFSQDRHRQDNSSDSTDEVIVALKNKLVGLFRVFRDNETSNSNSTYR